MTGPTKRLTAKQIAWLTAAGEAVLSARATQFGNLEVITATEGLLINRLGLAYHTRRHRAPLRTAPDGSAYRLIRERQHG